MGLGAGEGIDNADQFELEGVRFVPGWWKRSEPGSLVLLKAADMVPVYRELLGSFSNPRMVELGISQGGSVALLALLARPAMFVAVELDPTPIEPLLAVLREKGLGETVRPYFGVDQADRVRLAEIIEREFGDEQLDLVIDDASHRYEPTVASFEVLFPRMAPGGLYVIEDWTAQDVLVETQSRAVSAAPDSPAAQRFNERVAERMMSDEPPERPISRLALELTMAVCQSDGAVAEVRVDENWIVVRRGDRPLPPGTRLSDLYQDHFRQLGPRPTDPA